MSPPPSLFKILIFTVFAIAFLLFNHFWAYQGHFGIDDLHYARLAKQWADGDFSISTDHYSLRWGIIFSVGMVYWLFGVSDFSSALPALFSALFILLLLLYKTRQQSVVTAVFVLSACLFSNWFLFYADKIMPDMLVALCITLAALVLHSYYYGRLAQKPVASAFVLALCCWIGYLCKETIFLLIPWLLFWSIIDIWKRQNILFWLYFVAFSVLGLLLYGGYCYAFTGDFFFRFYAIRLNSYFSPCSYDQLPIVHLLRRVGYELFTLFLQNGFFLVLPWALAGLVAIEKQQRYWSISALVLLFSCNFMSASPTAYTPLCLDPRHYLFMVPSFALAAAFVFEFHSRKQLFFILVFSWLMAFWAWIIGSDWNAILPFIASVIAALFLLVQGKQKWLKPASLLILMAAWLVQPMQTMLYSRGINYQTQKAVILQHLKPLKEPYTLVLTDIIQKNFGEYLLAFDSSAVRFKTFAEVQQRDIQQAPRVLILLNGYTRYMCGLDWNQLPTYAKEIQKTNTHTFIAEDGVELYEADKNQLTMDN